MDAFGRKTYMVVRIPHCGFIYGDGGPVLKRGLLLAEANRECKRLLNSPLGRSNDFAVQEEKD